MAKIFPTRINTDVSDVALQPTECRSKTNLRSGLVSGSNAFSNENIQSNILIDSEYYETGDVVIGACEDISNDSILFDVYNPDATKNKILRYYPFDNDKVELILKHEHLGFKLDWKITQHNIISGLYYFTFGWFDSFLNNQFSPPRKINIEKAKKFTDAYPNRWEFTSIRYTAISATENVITYLGDTLPPYAVGDYIVPWADDGINRDKKVTGHCRVLELVNSGGFTGMVTTRPWQEDTLLPRVVSGYCLPYVKDQYFGIDWQVLDRIKYKPMTAPGVSFGDDPDRKANLIRGKQFQLCFAHGYDDNEKTVASFISPILTPTNIERFDGSYDETKLVENYISTWVDTGSMEVKTIYLYAKESNIGVWKLVKTWHKYDEDGNCEITSDIYINHRFYNDESYFVQPEGEIERPFDFVPQIVHTQELIEKNRLSDSNYVEGYDNVNIDVELTATQTELGTLGSINNEEINSCSYAIAVGVTIPAYIGGTSGAQYFHCGKINFQTFWEAGYDYNITISCIPNKYIPLQAQPYSPQTYPTEFYGKNINSTISVSSELTDTIDIFLNQVAGLLRTDFGGSNVIGINNYAFKDMTGYTEFHQTSGGNFCNQYELGFIYEDALQITGNQYTSSQYQSDVVIHIEKSIGRKIYPDFKSGETKNFAFMYFDRAGRTGAANASDQSKIYIKSQIEWGFPHTIYQNNISWAINHIPPDWADYGIWMIQQNKSFYNFAVISEIHVAASGNLSMRVNDAIITQATNSKGFNVKPYVWEKGDRVRFMFNKGLADTYTSIDGNLDMEIIGELLPGDDSAINTHYKTDGLGGTNYIVDALGNKVPDDAYSGFIVSNFNYTRYGISAHNTIVEIYRPLKNEEEPKYVEFGEPLPIIDPHTANRRHSGTKQDQTALLPATGTFEYGDAWVTNRNTADVFPVERANFSDFYKSDSMSIGLPSIENREMRREEYISYQRYSQILIENSLTNGLSTFHGSDFDVLPTKYEKIYSAKEVGEVLRVIQKNKCHSIYIGKGEMKQPVIGDSGVVAISPSVIGSRRDHVEAYGTVFPESVVNSNNFTYFFDIYNSVYVRWSTNGLQQITYKENDKGWDYGMGVYFRNKCTALLESGIDNVKVYAVFEKEYENLIVTFIDKVTPANSETIVFHEPSNSWTMKCSYLPEYYGTNKKVLVMAQDGQLWKANTGTDRNTFFGRSYKSEIEVVGHEEPDKNYVFNDIEIVTNSDRWEAPNTGDVQVNLINGTMKSRLKNGRFTNREGVMVATFGKDMTTSGVELQEDLITGRELRGHAVTVRLENDSTDEVVLTAININSTISE